MIHQPVIKKVVSGGGTEGWYPPADWGWDAASALISDSDNGFVALVAVFPNIIHRFAFTPTFSGTATVDWGDGSTPESLTSATKAQHEFDYANIPGSVTACGFKVAVVKMNSTSYFLGVNFDVYHAAELSTAFNGMVALKIRAIYNGSSLFTYVNQIRNRDLFFIDVDINHFNMSYAFYAHSSLRSIVLPKHPIFGAGFMFARANISAIDWNNYDFSSFGSLHASFIGCKGDPYSLNISIPLATTLSSAFENGTAFRSITLRDTGLVTSIAYCLHASTTCKYFNMNNCAAVTNTSYFIYTGANYIENLILTGLTVGINLSNGKMNTAACNAFLTALGTANGTQTINLAGNPGALTCDASIGTAKGYTIITS